MCENGVHHFGSFAGIRGTTIAITVAPPTEDKLNPGRLVGVAPKVYPGLTHGRVDSSVARGESNEVWNGMIREVN